MAELKVTLLCLLAVTAAADTGQNTSDFHLTPRSVSGLANSTVKFKCQAGWDLASASLVWYINDTVWSRHDIEGIYWSSIPDPHWNSPLRTLHFPALRECNNSRVQCVLYLDHGQTRIYSEDAVLVVRDSFFHHSPQSINVTLGSTAEFHCQPSISDSLASWNINNMSLHMFNSSDVVSVSEQDSTWNINRSTLYVIAHHMLNNSVVHCIINSNGKAVATSEADLMIQGVGQLRPVRDLRVADSDTGYILITWTAPFSLNITGTDLDILYSVTVTTAGGRDNTPHCDNITDTFYNFTTNEIPNGMYQFEVTSVNSIQSASKPEILNIYIMTGYNEHLKLHNLNEPPTPLHTTVVHTISSTTDYEEQESVAACSVFTSQGIGIGVLLGAIVTISLVGMLLALYWCSYKRSLRHHRRGIPRDKLEPNPAYESCSPLPAQATFTSSNGYHTQHETRKLASYPLELTPPQEGLYEVLN